MDGFNNLSVPAWTALSADIVPIQWRGRYYGTRNSVMGVANMIVTYLGGTIITAVGGILGYQIGYMLASLFGGGASYSFAKIQEAPRAPSTGALTAYSPKAILQTLHGDRNFLMFCASMMVWNFSLNIAGPFFSVYMVEELKSTAAIVGVLGIVSSLAGLPALRFFGGLNDRWGSRRVLLLVSLLIPFLPPLWIFMRGPWDPLIIQVLSGILWAGQGLASFNFLLEIAPAEGRARYSALFQIAVMLALALGAAAGGVLVETLGYQAIFIASGIGRMAGALLMWRLVRPHPAPV
jgi:MFS family permease